MASALLPRSPDADFCGEVRNQLDRMLDSTCFRRSPRLSRFLRFVVDQSLRGEDWKLKEYSIAVEVFRKPEDFDPRLDSAVRVAARQLRAKLDRYYSEDGRMDPILIRFRPGDYVPRVFKRDHPETATNGSIPNVLIVDGDRRGAHAVAECLDPATCRITAVTNDSTRALALLQQTQRVIVMAGVSVCGGLTGCELLLALRNRRDTASVAVLSAASTGVLVSQVVACEPDAVVFRPLRQSDVETAVRIAALCMSHR